MNCRVVQGKGITDFFSAAGNGDAASVERLLKQGCDVNTKDDEGKTSLMYAATNGHISVVKLLLEAGADVDAKDECGATASEFAECESHFDIACLIEGNACPFCSQPAVEDDTCPHFLGSTNDCGLSTPLDFDEDVTSLAGFVQSLADDEYKDIISKAPLILRELLESAHYNDNYWTEDKDIMTKQWETRGIDFHFHPDAKRFAEKIEKNAERGIAWLKKNTAYESK